MTPKNSNIYLNKKLNLTIIINNCIFFNQYLGSIGNRRKILFPGWIKKLIHIIVKRYRYFISNKQCNSIDNISTLSLKNFLQVSQPGVSETLNPGYIFNTLKRLRIL